MKKIYNFEDKNLDRQIKEIVDSSNAPTLQTPDGSKVYRIVVDNNGNLSTVLVP
jgi:hypothetical protein